MSDRGRGKHEGTLGGSTGFRTPRLRVATIPPPLRESMLEARVHVSARKRVRQNIHAKQSVMRSREIARRFKVDKGTYQLAHTYDGKLNPQ